MTRSPFCFHPGLWNPPSSRASQADPAPAAAAAAAPRGNLHFNRSSGTMRGCVEASSRKRTQLHQVSNEPSRRFRGRRRWYFGPFWAYGDIYINIHTRAYLGRQSASRRWDFRRAASIRGDEVGLWARVWPSQLPLSFGGGGRKEAWPPTAVVTEHDGSIAAVIRHQTKGTWRRRERGEEDAPRHSGSITRPPDEVSAPERQAELGGRVAVCCRVSRLCAVVFSLLIHSKQRRVVVIAACDKQNNINKKQAKIFLRG